MLISIFFLAPEEMEGDANHLFCGSGAKQKRQRAKTTTAKTTKTSENNNKNNDNENDNDNEHENGPLKTICRNRPPCTWIDVEHVFFTEITCMSSCL